jgi:hypothetical protein
VIARRTVSYSLFIFAGYDGAATGGGPMSDIDNRRQEDRCGVAVRAVVHGPKDQRFDGRVRNISPTGACVE